MNPLSIILGVSNIFVGLLCVALAIPLRAGRVKRNNLYGVRFPQSLASDEAWLAINRYGATRLMLWASPLIPLGVITFFLPLTPHGWTLWIVALAPLIVLVPAVESWLFARRYSANR
jgi:hypothetical protein